MIAYLAASRARLRRRLDAGDEGFTLVYTLLVITLITVLVGSALVVAAANVVPAVNSAYSEAANAAALSGIDDFRAKANAVCKDNNSVVTACKTIVPLSGTGTLTTSGAYSASYRWTATPGTNWFRVTSTGTVGAGSIHKSRTLVADVQGGGSTQLFDYNVVVGYETQAPDVVATQYPARTIKLTTTAARSAASTSATSVSWNGAQSGSSAGTVNVCNALYAGLTGRSHNAPPNASTPYVDWAESGTAGSAATVNQQPCQVSMGHSTTLEAVDPAAIANGQGGYATHDALLLSNSFPGGTGPLLNQRVTSGYRYDPSTATACDSPNRDYRSFNLVCAGYGVEIGGTPAPGSTYTPQYNATLPNVPTSACSSGSTCTTPAVPSTGSCIYTGPTRVYLNANGTATITSPQTTAAASGSPTACYPSSLGGGIFQYTTPALSGISGFNGIFAVRNKGTAPSPAPALHSATGWKLTGQQAGVTAAPGNTVFYRRFDPATSPDTPSIAATKYTQAGENAYTWTMYSSTKKCGAVGRQLDTPNGPKPWDEQTFQCDWFGKMGDNTFLPPLAPSDAYTSFQNQFASDLASTTALTVPGNPGSTINATVGGTTTKKTVDCSSQTFVPTSATNDQLSCLIQHDLHVANTGLNEANWTNPNKTGYTHQYIVSGYTQTTTTTPNKQVGGVPTSGVTDPLFDGVSTGSASTETATTTTTTFNVASQVYTCYDYGLVGTVLGSPTGTVDIDGSDCGGLIPTGKWGWGDGYYPNNTSAQFQVTLTSTTYSNFVQGASATAYFPSMQDVTQYAIGAGGAGGTDGPGDLYVEGTANTTLSFVADNDVELTGSLAPSSTSSALEVVARGNVRMYHPVQCAAPQDVTAIQGTTPGFCPNDITGLYSGVAPTGTRPDQQYTNLRASGTNSLSSVTINAAVFALGGAVSTVSCPQWSGTGVCGGEFSVDNYNRGSALTTLTVKGTLVMQHHGPVGREWEIADTTGQTSRPYSGYQLDLKYQNLRGALTATTAIASVVSTVSTTSSAWHVVSVSTGSS